MSEFDYLIVGAGFSGLVMAEQICNRLGQTCLVVDRRAHIGGNAYDALDAAGVLIHKYGPHYFRTNSARIREYLSQFTQWREVNYIIKSFTDGRYWSFPINLNTFEQLLGRESSTAEFEAWLATRRSEISHPKNSEEVVLAQVGEEFYKKFFEGYTLKQWKQHPRDLDASVCGRIPVRTNRDERYLSESFQALPAHGYTRLFENLVASCGARLRLELDTDYRALMEKVQYGRLIYTGAIDEFFGCCFGPLPYRSLQFAPESFTADELRRAGRPTAAAGFWQPYLQVNYPNSEAFTRIVEVKHITGQQIANTTIVREYPADYTPGAEPYYPIPNDANQQLYERYAALAAAERNVVFLGRLANYRYLNMDQVVGMALSTFEKHFARNSAGAP